MTRRLEVRSRVESRPEPPFDRLHDPVIEDLMLGGEFARERVATLWSDGPGLARLAEAKRGPLDARLAEQLAEYHQRLGASARSLQSLERLARGEAVAAVAGQQPAPLGGPLYSLHKTASAVGLAATVTARTGVPCVPLFWTHGEDSDFAEIRSATIGDSGLSLKELSLPESAHREGGLVGAIPAAPLAELFEQAIARWEQLPARQEVAELMRGSVARARDLGEAYSALMLALFGDQGLVVIDPRLPAFRAAARGIVERYLESAESLAKAARSAGDRFEARWSKRPLADAALESFVFAIEDGTRHKLSVSEARALGRDRPLSPSVALRAALQDGVFPTVAMACGSSEVAYLAQLREVFEGLGIRSASPVPRLGATWLPPPAVALLEASGADVWELVTGADQVLKRLAEQAIPAEVSRELERARAEATAALQGFAASAARVDASLPQMVESARAKVDYQYARLLEGLAGKVRHHLERRHPEWPRVRYYLMPGDRLQERRVASLEVVAYRGRSVVGELCVLAEEQARRAAEGRHDHLVLEL